MPPKPLGPYIIFVKDLKNKIGESKDLGKGFLAEASKQWGELSEEGKKEY